MMANLAYQFTDNHHIKFRTILSDVSPFRDPVPGGHFDDLATKFATTT